MPYAIWRAITHTIRRLIGLAEIQSRHIDAQTLRIAWAENDIARAGIDHEFHTRPVYLADYIKMAIFALRQHKLFRARHYGIAGNQFRAEADIHSAQLFLKTEGNRQQQHNAAPNGDIAQRFAESKTSGKDHPARHQRENHKKLNHQSLIPIRIGLARKQRAQTP